MKITQKTLQDKLKGFKKIYNGDDKLTGTNLWEAVLHENDVRDGYGTLRKIYEKNIDAAIKDECFRDEYMPKDLHEVFVVIGNKNREIHIDDVRAKNEKEAVDKKRQDIGAEFLGLKYKIMARHKEPDMTEEKFINMVYESEWERPVEELVEGLDTENDKEIAKAFKLDCEITGFIDDIDNREWHIDDLKDFCKECKHPLVNEHFDVNKECPYCGYDLRTVKEKVVDRLTDEDES